MTINIFLKRVLALGLVVCCFFISGLVVNKGHFRFFVKGAGETVLYVGGNTRLWARSIFSTSKTSG